MKVTILFKDGEIVRIYKSHRAAVIGLQKHIKEDKGQEYTWSITPYEVVQDEGR